MTTFTHEIVRMERSSTKGSGSPMWRCTTKNGERVNVFQHSDPMKDNTAIFREAGYFGYMESLKVGEAVEWSQSPIWVVMESDGKWWSVVTVGKKPFDAEPDVLWQPDLELYRNRARMLANWLISRGEDALILDVEETGLRTDDEMMAIACIDTNGEIHINTLILPPNPDKLLRKQKDGLSAADITGIRPEQLVSAPNFTTLYQSIHEILDGAQWIAYNVDFDVAALDRECSNAGLPLLTNNGVFDVALIAAEYLGNWNPKRQWFEMLKLSEAASRLGIMVDVQHDAKADALTTYKVLCAIAAGA